MDFSTSSPDIFRTFALLPYAGIVLLALTVLLHILFAVAVARDASRLHLEPPFRGTALVGLATWTLATLVGGVFVAAIYWLLNRSTLRPTSITTLSEPQFEEDFPNDRNG
jgi:hypothetical protein